MTWRDQVKDQKQRLSLLWLTRETVLDAAFEACLPVEAGEQEYEFGYLDQRRLRVAAVSVPAAPVASIREFVGRCIEAAQPALTEKAQLLVYPGGMILPLTGLVDDLETWINDGILSNQIFSTYGAAFRRIYGYVFSRLARQFRVYIVAGSALLPGSSQDLRETAFLYGPDGRLLHWQDSIHPARDDLSGIAAGDRVNSVSTAVGNAGIAAGRDGYFFEVGRLLAASGVEWVAMPSWALSSSIQAPSGSPAWARAQELGVYTIEACLQGEWLDHTLGGSTGIYAPVALDPHEKGILAQTGAAVETKQGEPAAVVAEIDLVSLRRYQRKTQVGFHPDLYAKYLPEVYTEYETRDVWHRNRAEMYG